MNREVERTTYDVAKLFKKKYPMSMTWWRLKKHCKLVDQHINPGEKVLYVVAGQLDNNHFSWFNTGVVVLTNHRLIVAQDRLLVGYKYSSITPDLYNDLTIEAGFIWGMLTIDTVKEKVFVSNLDNKSLGEIETNISTFMMDEKKKYAIESKKDLM